jgi:hypothetical protein
LSLDFARDDKGRGWWRLGRGAREADGVLLPSGFARRSWWTYLSLTLASALIGHLVFDAVDDGLIAIVTRPIHLVYLLVVVAAFSAAAVDLYWHEPSERRRRIALMRGTLCNGRKLLAISLLTQVVFAAATILLENEIVDGWQLAVSALCALLALLFGTFALRRVESEILRLVSAAFITRRPRVSSRPKPDSALAVAIAYELTYCLFRPNRPPPALA